MKPNFSNPLFILVILSISHFFVDFMIGIWPVFKTIAGLDLALAGLIYGVGAACGEGLQIVFGRLSDNGYKKALVILGLSLTPLGALYSYTSDYALLFLLFWIVCIGSGAFHPAAVGLVGKLSDTKKATYITFFAAFGALGMAVSQISFSWAYSYSFGNTIFLMVPSLLLALFCFKKMIFEAPASIKAPKVSFNQFLLFFKQPALRNLYLAQLCNQAIAWGLIFLLPDVLKSREYEPWMVYGGGHLAYVMGGVFLLIPSGILSDRYSSKSVIWFANLFGLTFFYLFLCMPELGEGYTIALLFMMGASISIVNPVSIAFGNQLAPKHPGMISAFLMGCVWCVSECIGPGGGGLLTKLFTEDAPARALMILGVLFFGALLAVYKLPSTVPSGVAKEEPNEVELNLKTAVDDD